MNRQVNGTAVNNAHTIDSRAVVHQAVGMMSVQLGVPVAVAMDTLRAYAVEHGRILAQVAADVVARRLRFDPGGQSVAV